VRILYVIGSLSMKHGGPSKACLEMANAMAARGHRVDLFTTDQDGVDARLDVPIGTPVRQGLTDVTYFHCDVLRTWPCASIGLARALRERAGDYDLVHTHSLYLAHGIAVRSACERARTPYVIRPCGALDPVIHGHHRGRKAVFEALFERENFRRAAAIHFTSEDERRHASAVMPVPAAMVVPLGLNLAEYAGDARSLAEAFPQLAGKRVVLFLGRLTHKKGLDVLIPAFARAAAGHPDVHLALAGPDAEGFRAKVEQWIAEQKIGDRVSFLGMVEGEAKLAALRGAEVFALSSYGENFGVAVAEALASALPVVITDQVGIWRDVDQGGAGVVTRLDVEDFSNGLDKVLGDARTRNAMSAAARRLAEQAYGWPAVAEQLETEYARLLGRSRHAEAA
jgi:glycosyltransferase involved in cell wall biosynthesis